MKTIIALAAAVSFCGAADAIGSNMFLNGSARDLPPCGVEVEATCIAGTYALSDLPEPSDLETIIGGATERSNMAAVYDEALTVFGGEPGVIHVVVERSLSGRAILLVHDRSVTGAPSESGLYVRQAVLSHIMDGPGEDRQVDRTSDFCKDATWTRLELNIEDGVALPTYDFFTGRTNDPVVDQDGYSVANQRIKEHYMSIIRAAEERGGRPVMIVECDGVLGNAYTIRAEIRGADRNKYLEDGWNRTSNCAITRSEWDWAVPQN